uniref:Uncharacterized protein n=1 Tax=Nothoprocta perdicaria TaxID=30464 RepID=A0A8C6Z141_NOTPE
MNILAEVGKFFITHHAYQRNLEQERCVPSAGEKLSTLRGEELFQNSVSLRKDCPVVLEGQGDLEVICCFVN